MLMTSTYAALGEDLLTGQIKPASVSQSWYINPREEHIDSALARTLREHPLDRSIQQIRPQDPAYDSLRTQSSTRGQSTSTSSTTIPGS